MRIEFLIHAQMQTLLGAIPEAQGIFHLDLTSDECLSINGSSKSLDTMKHKTTVDDLVRQVAAFVPDERGKEEFFSFFSRESLLKTYRKGKASELKKQGYSATIYEERKMAV